MSSKFGWSLPPGCSMRDIDPDPGPCQVCGRDPDGDCLCPECPTCGAYGDPKCYESHGLVRTPEQIASRKAYDDACERDAKVQAAADAEYERTSMQAWEQEDPEQFMRLKTQPGFGIVPGVYE